MSPKRLVVLPFIPRTPLLFHNFVPMKIRGYQARSEINSSANNASVLLANSPTRYPSLGAVESFILIPLPPICDKYFNEDFFFITSFLCPISGQLMFYCFGMWDINISSCFMAIFCTMAEITKIMEKNFFFFFHQTKMNYL